jgi:hypothetical protein
LYVEGDDEGFGYGVFCVVKMMMVEGCCGGYGD